MGCDDLKGSRDAKVFSGPVYVYLQFAEHHNLTQCTVSSIFPLTKDQIIYFFDGLHEAIF